MNPKVDLYLIDGCGRCPLYATPQCKVNNWKEELQLLRSLVLDSELTEELKWGVPCYTFQNKNVLTVAAFKEYCSISFFKGSLLSNKEGLLEKPGENSQAARLFRFRSIKDIRNNMKAIQSSILEAIELEKKGQKVEFNKNREPLPEELEQKLKQNTDLKKAFYALSPGRQRGYILHFSSAKQSQTRVTRIEKCIPRILKGKGFHD